jgi:preprotein translocase subunit SecF
MPRRLETIVRTMITSFLCLVAVHNEYYSQSGQSSTLFWTALGIGISLSLIVVMLPIIRWFRKPVQNQGIE